jgi:hypothetical protein
MDTVAMLVGSAALLVAALVVLLHLPSTRFYTMTAPSGPDSMGLALYFFALIAAWVLIAVAMFAGIARGAYDWTGLPGAGNVLGAILLCVGLGTVCIAATFASMSTRTPARTPMGLAGGFMVPAVTIAFAGAMLWGPVETTSRASWAWWFAAPIALVSLGGWAGLAVAWVQHQRAQAQAAVRELEADRERQERWREEERRRDEQHAKELAEMPDDAPLGEFVRHLFIDKSDAHHARVLERIRSLPNLRERLAGALAGPDPLEREYVLNFIRVGPEPDPSWAPLMADAMTRLAADLVRLGAGEGHPHPRGMTVGALMSAQRFKGVRFEREARELRDAIGAWPEEGSRSGGVHAVDEYLAGREVQH